eukprot:5227893-Alexandrium_andersonii.AAC.1
MCCVTHSFTSVPAQQPAIGMRTVRLSLPKAMGRCFVALGKQSTIMSTKSDRRICCEGPATPELAATAKA